MGGSRARSSSKRQRLKHSLKYMGVGWFSVIVFITICVILDFSNVIKIGYESTNGCWMSASLYFFGVPIALILVLNVTLYILTARAIHVAKSQARFATVDKDRKNSFGIYVRIASTMGFAWIFGFMASFGFDFLRFAFVFFNTLQGFYIALAFVINKRVLNLYKGWLSNTVNGDQNLSSFKTSRTSGIDNESVDTTL